MIFPKDIVGICDTREIVQKSDVHMRVQLLTKETNAPFNVSGMSGATATFANVQNAPLIKNMGPTGVTIVNTGVDGLLDVFLASTETADLMAGESMSWSLGVTIPGPSGGYPSTVARFVRFDQQLTVSPLYF